MPADPFDQERASKRFAKRGALRSERAQRMHRKRGGGTGDPGTGVPEGGARETNVGGRAVKRRYGREKA